MADNKKTEPGKKEAAVQKAVKPRKKTGPRGPRKNKEPRPASAIHVGNLILRVLKSRGMSKNKLAKALKLTAPTISLMVEGHSVQTDRLMDISKVLNYNFFAEIAEMVNMKAEFAKNMDQTGKSLQPLTAVSEEEIHFIKEENKFLRNIIELMAGKGRY